MQNDTYKIISVEKKTNTQQKRFSDVTCWNIPRLHAWLGQADLEIYLSSLLSPWRLEVWTTAQIYTDHPLPKQLGLILGLSVSWIDFIYFYFEYEASKF